MDKIAYELISKQTNDPIVEWRKCKISGNNFPIYQSDIDFIKKISPKIWNKAFEIPLPDICPEERRRIRLAHRNRRNLYHRKCDLTGKSLISMYSPDSPYKVYYNPEREKNIDWTDYWKEFDFNRPFFEQLNELMLSVPRIHAAVVTESMKNSDYVNWAHDVKDWYLAFSVTSGERILYSESVRYSKDCVDCLTVYNCEVCYECIDSKNLFHCFWCKNSINCSNCYLCDTCTSCQDCFGCFGLVNKQYYIFNKKRTKEEYQNFINKQKKHEYFTKNNIHKFQEISHSIPHVNIKESNCENCIWDNINDSKNCIFCFDVYDSEDIKYMNRIDNSKSCMDISFFGSNLEKCYNCASAWLWSQNLYFCIECYDNAYNLLYCNLCYTNVSNLFGCVGLRNKQYCILNKQYTKQEYEKLVPQIIEHMKSTWEWWQFIPVSMSTFGYNESYAQEHYPIEREEATKRWYKRLNKDYPINMPEWIEKILWEILPDNINKISDDILKKAIICKVSGKPFRIVKQELDFYRKHWLSVPKKHPNIRHKSRFRQKPNRTLYSRKCNKSWNEILSVYPQDVPFRVYSQEAYNKEIYW